MTLVLDASLALAWIFDRRKPTEAQLATAVLQRLDEQVALVPPLWHIETLNALVVAQRRGVITVSKAVEFLSKLDSLPIQTDDAVPAQKDHVFALAREYELSAYDATYLDLALRTGAALVTFDQKLGEAGARAGIPQFPG